MINEDFCGIFLIETDGRSYGLTSYELLRIYPELHDVKAHQKQQDGKWVWETWKEHTDLCMLYFQRIWESKHLDIFVHRFVKMTDCRWTKNGIFLFRQMFQDIVVFHDVGKVNPVFQSEKMKRAVVNMVSLSVGSQHSIVSALVYLDYYWDCLQDYNGPDKDWLQYFCLLFSFLISRHHAGLDDFVDYLVVLDTTGELLSDRLLATKVLSGYGGCLYRSLYEEDFEGFFDFAGYLNGIVEFQMARWTEVQQCAIFLLCRMGLSLLMAADYYATTEFMSGEQTLEFGTLESSERFRDVYEQTSLLQKIRRYKPGEVSCMNDLRCELFLETEQSLTSETVGESLFFLEAPTGSGKSNMAINLSLRFLELDKQLQKVFYIFPFNTLVSQTSDVIQNVFSADKGLLSDVVVVNSLTPIHVSDDSKRQAQGCLLDRQFWNYSWILSTHVQFFDMLCGQHRDSLFGFHQIQNAVVVLDEIQSYKQTLWSRLTYLMKAVGELCHVKFLIMSATLPDLDVLTQCKTESVHLVNRTKFYFQHPYFQNRVKIHLDLMNADLKIIVKHVGQFVQQQKKILFEFLSKQTAFEFYQEMVQAYGSQIDVECMTGDDNRMERQRIIRKIRESEDGIILVATQVVEAGVDIDMDVGYKAVSKLDSEEQFMGRINRSCLKSGDVYFFRNGNVRFLYGDDVRSSCDLMISNSEMADVLRKKDFVSYYKEVLQRIVKTDNRVIGGLNDFFRSMRQLRFVEIGKLFQLIDNQFWTVSVFFNYNMCVDGVWYQGEDVRQQYLSILKDKSLSYAEKKLQVSRIQELVQCFIYSIPKAWLKNISNAVLYDSLVYVPNGEDYMINGKLNLEKLKMTKESDLLIL